MIDLLIIFLSCQTGFNLVNSRLDAWLIFKDKRIAHFVNLSVFFILVGIEIIIGWNNGFTWWYALLFLFTSCLNRRTVFGISLNLRRRIKNKTITWDYISKDKPPKAWLDRQEVKIFGYNGNAIHWMYIILWVIFTTALFILTKYL